MPAGPVKLHEVLRQEYETLRRGVDFSGDNTSEVLDKLRQQKQPLSALCISSGGIRSATFALGNLQALTEHRLLGEFDYLSTVSFLPGEPCDLFLKPVRNYLIKSHRFNTSPRKDWCAETTCFPLWSGSTSAFIGLSTVQRIVK